ncbi:MAG: hypothetical protein R3F19_02660 [Verrucomicrobiales bacterium]
MDFDDRIATLKDAGVPFTFKMELFETPVWHRAMEMSPAGRL